LLFAVCLPGAAQPLRLAIAGLVHSHVDGFLHSIRDRKDVEVAGVFEPDKAIQRKYAQKYQLADSIFYTDLGAMLDAVKPEAVATFTSTYDHPMVVEACAQRHIPVMMEKPLAVSMDHARAIQQASARGGIPIVVNYETTWYRSHGAMWDIIKRQKAAGQIRKMVAMDGHQGPKEIGVPPEFFEWLTDPVKNGAGALFDFGCYGANLMTWMMGNQRPLAVTALTSRRFIRRSTMKPRFWWSTRARRESFKRRGTGRSIARISKCMASAGTRSPWAAICCASSP
jgi:predicted dehydrogenase